MRSVSQSVIHQEEASNAGHDGTQRITTQLCLVIFTLCSVFPIIQNNSTVTRSARKFIEQTNIVTRLTLIVC